MLTVIVKKVAVYYCFTESGTSKSPCWNSYREEVLKLLGFILNYKHRYCISNVRRVQANIAYPDKNMDTISVLKKAAYKYTDTFFHRNAMEFVVEYYKVQFPSWHT